MTLSALIADLQKKTAALPYDQRRRKAYETFNTTLADAEFFKLDYDQQDAIRNKFLDMAAPVKEMVAGPEDRATGEAWQRQIQSAAPDSMPSRAPSAPDAMSVLLDADEIGTTPEKVLLQPQPRQADWLTPGDMHGGADVSEMDEWAVKGTTAGVLGVGKAITGTLPQYIGNRIRPAEDEVHALERQGADRVLSMFNPKTAVKDSLKAILPKSVRQAVGDKMVETGEKIAEFFDKHLAKFGPSENIANKNVWDNPELFKEPEFWIYNTFQTAPSLAASMGPAALTYKVLSAGPAAVASFARIGAAVVGGGAGGSLEGAHTYEEVLKKTGDEQLAARSGELMGLFSAGLNTASNYIFLDKVGTSFMAKLAKHGKAGVAEGLTEGAEEPSEVVAKILAQYSSGKGLPDDIGEMFIESFKDAATIAPIAAITGAGASAVMGGSHQAKAPEQTPDPAQATDPATETTPAAPPAEAAPATTARRFMDQAQETAPAPETVTEPAPEAKPTKYTGLSRDDLVLRVSNLLAAKQENRLSDKQQATLTELKAEMENRGMTPPDESAAVLEAAEIEKDAKAAEKAKAEKKQAEQKAIENLVPKPTGKDAQQSAQDILNEQELLNNRVIRERVPAAKKTAEENEGLVKTIDQALKADPEKFKTDRRRANIAMVEKELGKPLDDADAEALQRARLVFRHERNKAAETIIDEQIAYRAAKAAIKPAKSTDNKSTGPKTLGGAIKAMGGINAAGLKSDILYTSKDASKSGLLKATGLEVEKAQKALVDEGWLLPSESLIDILSHDTDQLRRGPLTSDEAKTPHQKQQAQKLQEAMDEQYEMPPDYDKEGAYRRIMAGDLDEGANVGLVIDGRYDEYTVVSNDPFGDGVTLRGAGEQITIDATDSIELRVTDKTDKTPTGDRRAERRDESDRRTDSELRARYDAMSDEDRFKALYEDPLTGLGNRRAYNESERMPIQISIDADGLKWVNDTFDHQTGDVLIKRIADGLKQTDLKSYHPSGDEYWAEAGSDIDVDAQIAKVKDYLAKNPITATKPDGTEVTFIGAFSYGKGKTLQEAEQALKSNKAERELSGERRPRGSEPAGVLGESTKGNEAKDRGQGVREGVEPSPSTQAETPAAPSKREKALAAYQSYVDSLTDDQRALVADLIEADPKHPGLLEMQIRKAVAAREKAPAKTEGAKPLEPWQMTQREYQLSQAKSPGGVPILNDKDRQKHKNLVQLALNQGHNVPDRVLKDYPDLQAQKKPQFPPDRLMGIKVSLAMREEVDGVSFELYKPYAAYEPGGFTVVRDIETGNPIEIKKYPTIQRATDAHIESWTKASKMAEAPQDKAKAVDIGEIGNFKIPALAQMFSDKISAGQMPTNKIDVQAMVAEALGMKRADMLAHPDWTHKQVEEALEYAIVKQARQIIAEQETAEQTYKELEKLYNSMPNLSTRTSTSVQNQAYSTPVHLAAMMQGYAGIDGTKTVYEPTAGTGMLVTRAAPEHVWANEIDPTRFAILKDQNFLLSRLDGQAAVDHKEPITKPYNKGPRSKSFDAVMANPPFGSIAARTIDGYKISKLEHAIAIDALKAMKDDGKAAIIIGGEHVNDKGEANANQQIFVNYLHHHYNVDGIVEIPGEQYAKQGAKFPVRMILINGRKKNPSGYAPAPAGENIGPYVPGKPLPYYSTVNTIGQIADLIKEIGHAKKDSVGSKGAAAIREGSQGVGRDDADSAPDSGSVPRPAPAKGARPDQQGDRPGSDRHLPESSAAQPEQSEVAGTGLPGHAGHGGRVGPSEVPSGNVPSGQGEAVRGQGESETGGQRQGTSRPATVPQGAEGTDPGRVPGTGNIDQTIADLLALSEREAAKAAAREKIKSGTAKIQSGIKKFNDLLGQSGEVGTARTDPGKDPRWNELHGALSEIWTGLKDVHQGVAKAAEAFIKDIYHQLSSAGRPFVDKFIQEDIRKELEKEARAAQGAQKPAQEPAPPAATEEETDYQTVYNPKSKGPIIDTTLMPKRMKEAVEGALSRLEERRGDIDTFVARKLAFKNTDELYEAMSADQIDAVALAIDNIENGAGMVIGDQTGVGKGRIAAAIWKYARLNDQKPVFFTAKPQLFTDFYRDITDIGYDFNPLLMASKQIEGTIVDKDGKPVYKVLGHGPRTAIYRQMRDQGQWALGEYDGVLTTYSQVNQPRLQQMALHPMFNGNIAILDEAHKAAGPDSETGNFVRGALENVIGVVYLSATFAKRPDTMPLYFKTDMSRANLSMEELISAVESGDTPLQEILSSDLAKVGQYVRREKSFKGIGVRTITDTKNRARDEQRSDAMTSAMRGILHLDVAIEAAFRDAVKKAKKGTTHVFGIPIEGAIRVEGQTISSTVTRSNFAATAHNAVRQLLFAMKVDAVSEQAIEALSERSHIEKQEDGKYRIVNQDGTIIDQGLDKQTAEMTVAEKGRKVFIAVDNTMGAFVKHMIDEGKLAVGDEFNMSYSAVLHKNLDRAMTVKVTSPAGIERTYTIDPRQLPEPLRSQYFDTLEQITQNTSDIPGSPIDAIMEKLTRAGYRVGEITGREFVADLKDLNRITLRARTNQEIAAKKETLKAFNDGHIDVLIVNRSAAEGVSAHASPTTGKDLRPRTFIGAQAQLNIDDEVQLMGRINRKGQVMLPTYKTLFLDIPAELRPAAVLMRKMKSLSANTSANSDSPLSQKTLPDMDNKYGDRVVKQWLTENPQISHELNLSTDDGFMKASGKIAMMPVSVQRDFFEDVELEYNLLIQDMKEQGLYDLEVENLDYKAREIEKVLTNAGRDESNPFGASTYREKLSVLNPTKPYNKKRLDTLIEERLDGQAPAKIREDLVAEIRQAAAKYIDERRKAAEESGLAFDDGMVAGAADYARTIINRTTIGDTYRIQMEGIPTMTGVLLGYKWAKGKGNPVAGSRIRMEFAVNNALRKVTINMSRLEKGQAAFGHVQRGVVSNWDQITSTGMRQEIYMITGNLLQGFANVPQGSKIVRFTMADGTLREGIQLPLNYNPAENVDTVQVTPEQALQVLRAGSPLTGSSATITSAGAILVPKTRQAGGRFFLDDRLRSLVERGEFETRGERMRAQIIPGNEAQVINRIYELGDSFSVDRSIYRQAIEGAEDGPTFSRRKPVDTTQQDAVPSPKTEGDTSGQTTAAEQLRSSLEKYLRKPVPEGTITEARKAEVPDDTHAFARRLGKLYGKRVTYIHNNRPDLVDFDGVTIGNDAIYINALTQKPHHTVIGHELVHEMRRDYPDLYASLLESVRDQIQDIEGYRAKMDALTEKEGIKLSESRMYEELIADFVGDQMTDKAFWGKVADHQPSMFEKLIDFVKRFFQKMINKVQVSPGPASPYIKDIKAARQAAIDAFAEYADRKKAGRAKGRDGMPLFQREVWHGSPHKFDKFDISKIGTGEGAQAFGHGLYFTDRKGIAQFYKDKLSKEKTTVLFKDTLIDPGVADSRIEKSFLSGVTGMFQTWEKSKKYHKSPKLQEWGDANLKKYGWAYDRFNDDVKAVYDLLENATNQDYVDALHETIKEGALYKATLFPGRQDEVWLDWHKPVGDLENKIIAAMNSEKSGNVSDWESIQDIYDEYGGIPRWESGKTTGHDLYKALSTVLGSDKEASLFLKRAGIDGIRYPAGSLSGGKTEGTNYVVFDDSAVQVDEVLFQRVADPAADESAGTDNLVNQNVRIDSTTASILKGGIGLFESATDKLRRSKNPVLIDLAKRIDKYFDQAEARLGWINGKIRPHLKKAKAEDLADFKKFWQAHDNGRTDEAQAILDANPRTKALVEAVQDLYSDIGDINQTVQTPNGEGLLVYDTHMVKQDGAAIGRLESDADGNEVVVNYVNGRRRLIGTLRELRAEPGGVKVGGYRLIGKVPKGKFWPRALRPEVQRALQNPANDPKLFNELIDALIDEGHIADRSEWEAFKKGYFSDEVSNDYFAGIEKARGRKLPEIFYDYSWNAFQRYARKWSTRISQVEQFGQKIPNVFPKDEFDKVISSTLDRPTQNYVNALADQVYSRRPIDVYTTLMHNLNLLATATQLGNPATATLNILGGTALNLQMFGGRRVAKAYAELLTDWSNVQQTGVEYGILGKDVLNILRDTEAHAASYLDTEGRVRDTLARFAGFTMKWGGYTGTENIIRATGMIAARIQLQDALKAWNKDINSSTSKKYLAKMQRQRLDTDALLAENGQGHETAKYLRLMVNIPQGSYRIDQTPLYVDTPVGRFLFKYQKFTTQVSRMFWQNHLQPFVRSIAGGETVQVGGNLARTRTFLPLLGYFAWSFLGGTAILAARSALFGTNDPGPDYDEIEKALQNDERANMWAMIMSRAYASMMAASALGFFGNYIQFSLDVADQQRVKNPLDPPGLASINAVKEMVLRLVEQKTLTARDFDQIATQAFALYRGYKRMGATALQATNLKEVQLDMARRDMAYIREASVRYLDLQTIPARRTTLGRIGRTESSPLNQKLYEALILGDGAAARQIKANEMKSVHPAQRRMRMRSMEASVQSRHPLRTVGASREDQMRFLAWAKKNLPESKYQTINETTKRYERAARAAGL